MDRRQFLGGALLATAGAALPEAGRAAEASARSRGEAPRPAGAAGADDGWDEVRALFDLDPELVHLGGLLLSSHPRQVREAIDRHRRALDRDPVGSIFRHDTAERVRAIEAAAHYWGTSSHCVALTDSTTQGLSVLYQGMRLGPGDEVVRTEHEHYATWYNLDLKAAACGAKVRAVRLHDEDASDVEAEALVEAIVGAVGPKTRVLALTWVHSSTGLKLPLQAIAAALERRGLRDRLRICVDGVHGFGAENAEMQDLGCDFLVAGCHKWLHGPRGTGVVYAARPALWEEIEPIIPPFGVKHTEGLFRSPGGFHAFEHRWALAEAFALHQSIGKPRIAARVASLAGQLKEGLAATKGVRLRTPRDPDLSSGIVVFDVGDRHPERVIERLAAEGLVVTRSPYGSRSVRATPAIFNTPAEIGRLVDAVARIAG